MGSLRKETVEPFGKKVKYVTICLEPLFRGRYVVTALDNRTPRGGWNIILSQVEEGNRAGGEGVGRGGGHWRSRGEGRERGRGERQQQEMRRSFPLGPVISPRFLFTFLSSALSFLLHTSYIFGGGGLDTDLTTS